MDKLLGLAVKAHVGLDAWNEFQNLYANVSISGALWDQKGLPGLFQNTGVELKLHSQCAITHFVDIGERIVFTPNHVCLESEEGKVFDTRIDPRSAFVGQFADSKRIRRAYAHAILVLRRGRASQKTSLHR